MDRKLPKAIIVYPVFIPAVAITLLLVIGTISNPSLAAQTFDAVLAYITRSFGWFYMLSVAFFLVSIILMDLAWFPNAGSDGSVTFYFITAVAFPMALSNGWKRWGLFLFLLARVPA